MLLPLVSLLPLLSALIPATTSFPIEARTCPSVIINDGGFESGVAPPTSGGNAWTVVGFLGATSYYLSSPGANIHNGGKYAFTATVSPGPYSGQSGETLQQTLHTCVGKNYSITADFKFDAAVNNACSIKIEYPYKTTVGSVTTGSATPGLTPGVWATTGSTFQAVSTNSLLSIVFLCQNAAGDHISVDNVKVQQYSGNAY